MLEKEFFSVPLTEIRTIDGAKPVIEGHAAVFNTRSHDLGFREIIKPGAFADAVRNDDVKFLLNHEGLPIARTKSGTLHLDEDGRGLHFRAELDPADPDVQRLVPKVRRGDLSEMSFGFTVRNREQDELWTKENGEMIRTLLRVGLFDVSAVTFPAYPATDLQARSYFQAKMAELGKAATEPPPPADANFQARMKERNEFLARRRPAPDPYSLPELIRNASKRT